MSKTTFRPTELILKDDKSVYHLAVRPENIADKVIIVGDQNRVDIVSKYFDEVDTKIQNREFKTHTGTYKGSRISVMSTGIGTDNIDIFMNELDAAVNIDLDTQSLKVKRKSLKIVRLGTSGALHADIDVGSFIIAKYGLGLEGLMYYYNYPFSGEEKLISRKVKEHLVLNKDLPTPYVVSGSDLLFTSLKEGMHQGITVTASGFYAPQGRTLFLSPKDPTVNQRMQSFRYKDWRINNYEMETSAFYGLGKLLGHHCCTCCVALANRFSGEYCENYAEKIDELIVTVLDRLVDVN